MTHNYFYHLPNLPKLPTKYIELAQKAKYLFPEEHKMNNRVTLASCLKFQSTRFVNELSQKFSTIIVSFFRNEPHSFYDWHVDLGGVKYGTRQCCINYLVSENPGAVTMFKDYSFNRMNHKIVECDYTFLGATLFNTQHPHAVLNPTDHPRYVLSVSFFQNSFSEVLDYLKDLQVDSYE